MKYILTAVSFVACTLYSCLFPVPVYAHATGASLYATTSPYVIDVGYDPTVVFAGESTRFDFVLASEKTGASVPYSQVWIRIKDEEHTLLATGIFRQPFGPTTLLYVFPKPGTYTVQPSYRDADGNELAVASFSVVVQSAQEGDSSRQILLLTGALLIGGLIGGLSTRFVTRSTRRESSSR